MIMKTIYKFKSLFLAVLVIFTISSCNKHEDLIEELDIDREFAPIGLKAMIRNQIAVELNWTKDDAVENYVVEISDQQEFSTITETAQVMASQLPIQITLLGETLYYIRVKAISSRGLQDSKWATATAATLTEQLFLPNQPGDIRATEIVLRWAPNNDVSQIVITPGDMTHVITPQEKADGIATITGLTGETNYTATLFNDTLIRGISPFTTGIDIGDGVLVTPEDDLLQMIADANPGDVLVLDAGDYTAQSGVVSIDKPITIRGLRSYDKPLLKVTFSLVDGATDVSLIDLDLTGDVVSDITNVIDFAAAGNYDSLLISGCHIHDYDKSLIKGQTASAIVQSVIIENSIITNILTNSSDFIDFRKSNVLNLTLRTSTFNNCAPKRDFLRIDADGDLNGTGQTLSVLLDSCTIYSVSNTTKRILYVRFDANKITVNKTLFAETTAIYSNQSSTDPNTSFVSNNYFNAPGLADTSQRLFDESGTDMSLDPGFANTATGDFTISNQTLIDENIGDPRWRP